MSSSSSTHHLLLFLFISILLLLSSVVVSGHTSPGKAAARAKKQARRRNRESKEFLYAHNLARVASGASSLQWDKSLARNATKWAKQRKSDCRMIHSNGPYGENIFWYKKRMNWSPKRIVASWVEERLDYDRITNTCTSGKMCGHYTQIVWRATTAVGCGLVKCDNGLGFLVVCEYSPAGNYEGESPFDLPVLN